MEEVLSAQAKAREFLEQETRRSMALRAAAAAAAEEAATKARNDDQSQRRLVCAQYTFLSLSHSLHGLA